MQACKAMKGHSTRVKVDSLGRVEQRLLRRMYCSIQGFGVGRLDIGVR